jgi:hypothetical protein
MSNKAKLNVGQLLEMGLPARLAAFFNSEQITIDEFLVVSRYSVSKFVPVDFPFEYEKTAQGLSKLYGLNFRHLGGITIQAEIANENSISLSEFRELLFHSIAADLKNAPKSTEQDQMIALALWGLRGSADKSLYAVDVKDDGQGHVERVFHIIYKFSRIPIKPLNKRPEGATRDDQLRVDVGWFMLRVSGALRLINEYRAEILERLKTAN